MYSPTSAFFLIDSRAKMNLTLPRYSITSDNNTLNYQINSILKEVVDIHYYRLIASKLMWNAPFILQIGLGVIEEIRLLNRDCKKDTKKVLKVALVIKKFPPFKIKN